MTEEAKNLDSQVLMGALALPARLAIRLGTPLKEMKRLVELAAFGEIRGRGLKLSAIADRLAVSKPKANLLSRDFKQHFAAPETEFGTRRRILRLLWAQPLTRQRLVKALSPVADADEVNETLDGMIAEGRIDEVSGRTTRYQVASTLQRIVEDAWLSRLEALANMMRVNAEIIEARFFENDERAFARTIQVDVLPEDLPKLQQHYRDSLFPLIVELNDRADENENAVTVHLTIGWAPERDKNNE